MKDFYFLKYIVFCLIWNLTSHGQDWKNYPYVPSSESLVSFPLDEGRHSDEPIEWWYTAGHLTGADTGKKYSFMLTYFSYPQFGFDGFRILNISDDDAGSFFSDTKPVYYTSLATDKLLIEADVYQSAVESWKNKTDSDGIPIPFEYLIEAASSSVTLSLDYVTQKRPLIVDGDGFLNQGATNYTYYYSQTKNLVTGTISFGGTTENVTGTAWIDRQYGTFNPLNAEDYEWFSMQLSNGMDINLWNIFTPDRTIPTTPEYKILAAYVDEDNQFTTHNFNIERLEYEFMTDNLRCYSQKWRLTDTDNEIDLIITTLHNNSEVSLPFRFYEGATNIDGTVKGTPVTGIGFAELLHSYENPTIEMKSPSTSEFDPMQAISWNLVNQDEGRPLMYDLEYSTDNKQTYQTIIEGLEDTSYIWENPGLTSTQELWFRITGYSEDRTLIGSVESDLPHTLEIIETDNAPEFVFYPNPVDEIIKICFKDSHQEISYTLSDSAGKIIYTIQEEPGIEIEVDVSALSTGMYVLSVEFDGQKIKEKLLIK